MSRTVIIVQARMGSTRLPGKVLLPLAGQPMLERLIERLRRVTKADAIQVATTTQVADDAIAALCAELGVQVHRGSESDVLQRYADAAQQAGADTVVRVTADCPLLDPALLDQALTRFAQGDCDYLSNMLPPTWPYGLAVEVFSRKALQDAAREAAQPDEREHVTPFLYCHPQRFSLCNLASPADLSHHRWTVDTPQDYTLVRRLFEALYPHKPDFTLADLLALSAANPNWATINQHIMQKQINSTPALQAAQREQAL